MNVSILLIWKLALGFSSSCSIVGLIWKLALGFGSVVHVALYYPLFLEHVVLYLSTLPSSSCSIGLR